MAFDPNWETRYVENTHMSIWPWSDVVSLVHQHLKPSISTDLRVLELGCGAGANIPLFRALGINYYGIEGSPTIVDMLHKKFPSLSSQIKQGDFTKAINVGGDFDLILDRAALTHNTTASIQRTLSLVRHLLKPGGYFFGVDWFSTLHSDFVRGEYDDDENTKNNLPDGQFFGVGRVHFSDEKHLRELFEGFEIVSLEEKQVRNFESQDNRLFSSWNIVAKQPSF